MVLVFAAVVWQRNAIRAHWWAWRLTRTADLGEQGYFLACLSSVGAQAGGAAARLAYDDNPGIRLLSIYVLGRLDTADALTLLDHLLADIDPEVRDSAATALAFMCVPGAERLLCAASRDADWRKAAAATAGLARAQAPSGRGCLCRALESASAFVRAQAVESIAAQLIEEDDLQSATRPARDCNLVDVLVRAIADNGEFLGPLSIERQIYAAGHFAQSRGMQTKSDENPLSARKVGGFAAEQLSLISGLEIHSQQDLTPSQTADLADKVRRALTARTKSTPVTATMPAVGNAIRAASKRP